MGTPDQLKNQHVILYVDNESLVNTWPKRHAKRCEIVSILLQTLHILEAVIPCRIYMRHIKRCTTTEATLVDKLSRSSTTDTHAMAQVAHLQNSGLQGPLAHWLENPIADWTLPFSIANHVHQILTNYK